MSEEVNKAICLTGLVNGPVFTIPNGIDLQIAGPGGQPRNLPILIAGMKNPTLAKNLGLRLEEAGHPVNLQVEFLPRQSYLELLGRSGIVVTLPLEQEGFFLPALEAMAMGCLVICPDCIGNRSFCLNGLNCYRPGYNIDEIEASLSLALKLEPAQRMRMLEAAKNTVDAHHILQERSSFLRILSHVDRISPKGRDDSAGNLPPLNP